MTNSTRQTAAKYTAKLLLQLAVCALLYFLSAGRLYILNGIIYFAVYLIISLLGNAFLLHYNPETLTARDRIAPDTKCWDKLLLALYVPLAYYGIYIAAGLTHRLGGDNPSWPAFWIGALMTVLSSFLTVWSVHENRHFESSVRIQKDRDHTVCSSGPYAIVRHPGYLSIIVWAMAMPLMFGCYVGVISLIIVVLLTIRTKLEDNLLQRELPGYKEYSNMVRYRLLPLVW